MIWNESTDIVHQNINQLMTVYNQQREGNPKKFEAEENAIMYKIFGTM